MPKKKLQSLDPVVVINAYAQGIFPMADDDGTIYWYAPDPRAILEHRSEERRVGKECRSRWSPYH